MTVWSLSVSTVLLDALGRGVIDHAAYADLSPISQQTKRILLVFLQTFLEIGPSGLEVLARRVSATLPFSKGCLALSVPLGFTSLEAFSMLGEAFTYFLTCLSSRVWEGCQ